MIHYHITTKQTNGITVISYQHHAHRCELLMIYGKRLKGFCPRKFKHDCHDECDHCAHMKYVGLSDDGMKIEFIE